SGPNTTLDCSAPGVGFSNLPQFAPPTGTVDNRTPQGFSSSGMLVCLGDGSVRLVTSGISQQAWNWACNPDDQTPPPANWKGRRPPAGGEERSPRLLSSGVAAGRKWSRSGDGGGLGAGLALLEDAGDDLVQGRVLHAHVDHRVAVEDGRQRLGHLG